MIFKEQQVGALRSTRSEFKGDQAKIGTLSDITDKLIYSSIKCTNLRPPTLRPHSAFNNN